MSRVTVAAFPRLHVSLIDLAGATGRRFGGAGFCIRGPVARVTATLSHRPRHAGLAHLDERTSADLRALLERVELETPGARFSLRVKSDILEHVGLGSKTAILLAAATACATAAGKRLPRRKLQALSGRGGVSGIGVNGFFAGGFLIDQGHPDQPSASFLPSSAGQFETPPRVALRIRIPANWRFHCFLPKGRRYAGSSERRFFLRNTPIPKAEALRVLALVYHGLVPAVREANLSTLKVALTSIQNTGFKRLEVRGQPARVDAMRRLLDEAPNVAVGMSSLGPLLYAIAESDELDVIAFLKQAEAKRLGEITYLGAFEGQNAGYEVIDEYS